MNSKFHLRSGRACTLGCTQDVWDFGLATLTRLMELLCDSPLAYWANDGHLQV